MYTVYGTLAMCMILLHVINSNVTSITLSSVQQNIKHENIVKNHDKKYPSKRTKLCLLFNFGKVSIPAHVLQHRSKTVVFHLVAHS